MNTFRSALVEDLGTARRKLSRIEDRLDDITGAPPSANSLMAMRNFANTMEPLFSALEMATPAPMATESARSYKARLLSQVQGFAQDKNLRGVDLHSMSRLDDAGFAHCAREIVKDAQRTADDPSQGSFSDPTRLRVVKETDQSGRTWTTFKGSPMTWMSHFMFPSQCVTGFFGRDGRQIR
jgi:hypothetical protein